MTSDFSNGFSVGAWRVDPLAGEISADGAMHRLEPKVMDVLVCLAKRPGQVVERDTVIAEVWPGRVMSDDPLSRCITELRRAFGDSARDPDYIETIPKRGYRLLAEVGTGQEPISTPSPEARSHRRRWQGVAAIVFILALALFGNWQLRVQDRTLDLPSTAIAVMPFEDLSATDVQGRLGDAVAELVIHRLSQSPELAVISRNSTFAYKGQNVDPQEVAERLSAGTILQGTVQQGAGRFRVVAQLIDARNGRSYWSRVIDEVDGASFEAQDEIARALVEDVGKSLLGSVQTGGGQVALEAYQLYLLGRDKATTPQASAAVQLFEQAIEKDPEFAPAYAGLADALVQTVRNRESAQSESATLQRAHAMADRAIALGPALAEGYTSKLLLAARDGDYAAVDRWYWEAVERKPGHISAHIHYADALQRSGVVLLDPSRLDRAAGVLNRAIELDPLNVRVRQRLSSLASLRGDAEAIRTSEQAYADANSRSEAAEALFTLARITADRGRLDQAIAYLMIASDVLRETTGTLRLELASHHLQLQNYSTAKQWLDSVPRPLDFMGALQEVALYANSGQHERLGRVLEQIASGMPTEYAFSREEGIAFAMLSSQMPLNCERVFRLAPEVPLDGLRAMHMSAPDMLLSECHRRAGNLDLAETHRRHALDINAKVAEFPAESAFLLYEVAAAKAFAGDREAAIDHLEFSYDRGACFLKGMELNPYFDELRDHPRFRLLLSDFRETVDRMRGNVHRAETDGDWYQLVGIEKRDW